MKSNTFEQTFEDSMDFTSSLRNSNTNDSIAKIRRGSEVPSGF